MDERDLTSLKNRFGIVGNDPALTRALEIARSVAPTDLTVLVCGESGVGKENIPKVIHHNSLRKTGKYFAVNCGAIPEGTIDSELFGHEKGSFTGAVEMRRGYFEEADGGTLFLDEIAELPLPSQAKLLRVLQDGEFIRVGASKPLKTDVRVVAATNKDLLYAVSQGKFREDLYYRLSAITIQMPALRERRDDIHLLFRKFAADFAEKYSRETIRLTDDAVVLLKNYRWPGNVRQLKNVVESIAALETSRMTPGGGSVMIDSATLSRYIPKDSPDLLPALSDRKDGPLSPNDREMIFGFLGQIKREIDELKAVVYGGGMTAPALPQGGPEIQDPDEQFEEQGTERNGADAENFKIQDAEETNIRRALEIFHSRKEAAEALGIAERTLYRKIKEYGIK